MMSREDNRRLAEAYNEAMGIGDTTLDEELTDDPNEFTHDYAHLSERVVRSLRRLPRWIQSR